MRFEPLPDPAREVLGIPDLTITDVPIFYDIPRLYGSVGGGRRFVAVNIEETDDYDEIFLYIEVDEPSYQLMLAGKMAVRTLFDDHHGRVWRVVFSFPDAGEIVTAEEVEYDQLDREDLPLPETLLVSGMAL